LRERAIWFSSALARRAAAAWRQRASEKKHPPRDGANIGKKRATHNRLTPAAYTRQHTNASLNTGGAMIALQESRPKVSATEREHFELPACPACTGRLVETRGQMRCVRCHTLCEDDCEGGPEWLVPSGMDVERLM
jgi:hypothetical protein